MAEPIVEHIAANIATAVNGITVAAGYHYGLTAVRPTHLGFEDDEQPEDLTVLIVQEDPEEDPENASDGNSAMKAWVQPFALGAFVIESDSSTDPIDTRINRVRADIEKALMVDYSRGGYAIDTRIRGSARFGETSAQSGIAIYVDVLYRTRINDPYTGA